jgi:DNA-binding beta-propeller fold protein YncE
MHPPKSSLVAAFVLLATLSAHAGSLLVCNKGDQTMGIIDPKLGKQVAVIPEDGVTGHELVASADGARAFVPIYGNSGVGSPGTDGSLIRVIDLASKKIIGTVDFGHGVRPHCAVLGPKNHHIYVTTELDNSITEIDPDTLKIVGVIPTGQPESHMLCLTSDGQRGYTANVAPGTVSVLDISGRKLVTAIHVAPHTQRISISPDDHWVFTADTTKPSLVIVDTTKNAVDGSIDLPATAYGTAITPDGKWLVAALPPINKVAIIDITARKVAQTIDLPATPQEPLVQPDGAFAYVSCSSSRQVAMIDTKTWTAVKLIDAGANADGLAWAGN